MTINYSGDFKADVQRVRDLERADLDLVWVPEAYSFDAISQVGYLAAMTSTIKIGTGIINSYSRTARAVAQTAGATRQLAAVLEESRVVSFRGIHFDVFQPVQAPGFARTVIERFRTAINPTADQT